MHPARGLATILMLIVSTCFAQIAIKTYAPNESEIVDATVKILESCYGNRMTSMGLAGNLTGMISRKLWSRGSFSVTLIDARIKDNEPVAPQFRHKLQVFGVVASSSINTEKTLKDVKASTWWNHMAAFLIVAWPQTNHECSDAFDMLWAAWEMNVLNAKLLCHHRIKGRLIYAFNPYTSRAPDPWQLEKVYRGKNDHPWTLFVRRYEEGERVCKELDFEKANDMGGYEIRASVTGVSFGEEDYEETKFERTCVGLYEDMHCKLLLSALNAKPKVILHNSVEDMGQIDEKGNLNGILAEVMNGSSDIGFSFRYLSSLPNLTTSYPHWETALGSLTHYRGYKSQMSKIVSVIDIASRIGIFFICLVTVLFFKYFLNLSAMEAFLNTLRLMCNSTLSEVPTDTALRTYLGSLLLFGLTIQGIYQGQLASLLTKQEPLRNVDTINDLVELGYTIYGPARYRTLFSNETIAKRFIGTSNLICTEYVLRDPKAACLGDKRTYIYNATRHKLHLSHGSWLYTPGVFPIRPDWPVEERFNKILMRIVDTYQVQYQYRKLSFKTRRRLEIQRREMSDSSPKVLTLEMLEFAFVAHGIGLGCATICFVIEVNLRRLQPGIIRTLNNCYRQN